jgi:hypothetical protein
MDLGARKFGLVWFCSVFEPARADRRPECTMSTVAYSVFSLWRCRAVVFVAVLWLYSFCLRSSAIQYNLEINPLSTISSVVSFHKVDSTEIPSLPPYCPAGSNNSIGLPSGSSTWICLPPGPTSISFLKRTPSFLSSAIRAGKSCAWRTIRFHPPGSC